MIITRRALPRRTLLKGAGAAIGLPLLDAMVPALGQTPAAVKRLGFVYLPNGVAKNFTGIDYWTPAGVGADMQLSTILAPLAAHRDRLTVVSGLAAKIAEANDEDGATGDHTKATAAWLTGTRCKRTEGADIENGTSVDQIAAQTIGRDTPLPSLELSIDLSVLSGQCDSSYSCVYLNTLAWSTPTTPLPTENNPRAVFERLFGDSESTDTKARLARIQDNRSILDSVSDKVSSLERRLGNGDRNKLTEYLEAVRDVERRIQIAERQSDRELPLVERPSGAIPPSFEEHARLMIDLQVLAYQTDLTRVITFMISKELSNRTYPEIEVPDPHHPLSHHIGDPKKLEKLERVQTFHMRQFAYYLERLAATPDGDGSLLDNALIMYGSGMSDSNTHNCLDLPILLAGGGGGVRGGRHLRFPKGTPLTNLYLTLLDKMGVPAESIGDSTGRIEHLAV